MVVSALLEGTSQIASSVCYVSASGKWPSADQEEHHTRKNTRKNVIQEPRSLSTSVFLDLQNHWKRRPVVKMASLSHYNHSFGGTPLAALSQASVLYIENSIASGKRSAYTEAEVGHRSCAHQLSFSTSKRQRSNIYPRALLVTTHTYIRLW